MKAARNASADSHIASYGQLHYMGEHVGACPSGGTVVVHGEGRARPKPGAHPKGLLYCCVSKHARILETYTSLRVERIVVEN
ncbi:hypothetical protein QZM81_29665 [Burkholderia cepacia]|uniref:hypothetical protein n=1 Tax=Burkholderia cepacia TaxID=292 RepID=UPI0011BDC27F|nr:hypothetical protein [Burkholderia cepacia]MDN7859980.1 hypothetical protein [Burkholderia cepacia]